MSAIYDMQFNLASGAEQTMQDYRDKVLLIVNTASKCGFTPQFEGLEKLNQQFAEKGLVVLGFPCNQFGKQDPGSMEEISEFCQLNYGVSFTMAEKIEVNGRNAHPLYQHLKSNAKGVLGSEGIKWNFTKFLVNRSGEVVKRFASTAKPEDFAKEIAAIL